MTGLALALAVMLGGSPRSSDSQAALDALDYPRALELARAVLASGAATADETWRAYAVVGQAEAAMNHDKRATDAFARALSLHPGWALAPDASPRLTGPFLAAKTRLNGSRLTAAVERRCLGGARAEVTVRAEGDLESLVHGARLEVKSAASGFDVVPTAVTQVYVARWDCASPRCAFYVELLDEAGNAVLQAGSAEALLEACDGALEPVAAAPAPAAPNVTPAPAAVAHSETVVPLYRRPGVYFGVLALVAAGTGVAFSAAFSDAQGRLIALDADRANHTLAEGESLDAARHFDQGALIVAFAATAVAAALAIWLW